MKKLLLILTILVFAGSTIAFGSGYQDVNIAGNAATATALAANGTNCAAGQAAKGMDASGNAEGCSDSISGNAGTVTNGVYTTGAGTVFLAPSGDGSALTNVIHTEVDPTVDTSAEIQSIIGAGVYDASGAAAAIAGGRSTTRNTNDIDLDAEIYTKIANVAIQNPLDTMDAIVQLQFPTAVTIVRVTCSTDTGTADIQFDERSNSTPNSAGTDVLSSALQCDDNEASTTSFNNAGIAADSPMSLDIDAVASTPTKLRIAVKYTIDD